MQQEKSAEADRSAPALSYCGGTLLWYVQDVALSCQIRLQFNLDASFSGDIKDVKATRTGQYDRPFVSWYF